MSILFEGSVNYDVKGKAIVAAGLLGVLAGMVPRLHKKAVEVYGNYTSEVEGLRQFKRKVELDKHEAELREVRRASQRDLSALEDAHRAAVDRWQNSADALARKVRLADEKLTARGEEVVELRQELDQVCKQGTQKPYRNS